jgi:hypothetical protein
MGHKQSRFVGNVDYGNIRGEVTVNISKNVLVFVAVRILM